MRGTYVPKCSTTFPPRREDVLRACLAQGVRGATGVRVVAPYSGAKSPRSARANPNQSFAGPPPIIPLGIGTPAPFAAMAAAALSRSYTSSWSCLTERVLNAPVLSPVASLSCTTARAESKRIGSELARGNPIAPPEAGMPVRASDE